MQQYNANKSLDVVLKQNQLVKTLVQQETNKILLSASKIYSLLCGDGEVVCIDQKFAIKTNGVVLPFEQMSVSDKFCLFLSLKLCDLQSRFAQCKTILLHGTLSANVDELMPRLARLNDFVFVAQALSTDLSPSCATV